jgi:uncharacterized protein (DUF1778 family)
MNALTIRLPDSIHKTIKKLAKREGCSVNQFLASAAAEKMSALLTLDYLRAEAAEGRREDFETFLAAVPEAEPMETDRVE